MKCKEFSVFYYNNISIMGDNKRESDFQEGLNQYYTLKDHYYKSLHKKQKKIKNDTTITASKKKDLLDGMKQKCVNCKREVGTSFSENNRIFRAVCGDVVNPCKLHIELNVGKKHHINEIINITEEIINDTKEEIIKLKMDLAYNYKSHEEIMSNFNVLKRRFIDVQKKMDNLIKIKSKKLDIANRTATTTNYENAMHQLISTINNLIKEYNRENDLQKISEIINIYNDSLREIIVNIRTNKYYINRVNIESKKEPGNITTYGTLIQNEVDDDAMFIYFDDDEKSVRKVFRN